MKSHVQRPYLALSLRDKYIRGSITWGLVVFHFRILWVWNKDGSYEDREGKWADRKCLSHLSPFSKDSQGAIPFCIMGCAIAVQLHSPEKGTGIQLSSLIQFIFLSAACIFYPQSFVSIKIMGLRIFDLDEFFGMQVVSFLYFPPSFFLTSGWGKMAVTDSSLSNWVIIFSWTLCIILFLFLVLLCSSCCVFLKFRILYFYRAAFGSLHCHSPSFAVFVQHYNIVQHIFLLAASNTDAMWWPSSLSTSLHYIPATWNQCF